MANVMYNQSSPMMKCLAAKQRRKLKPKAERPRCPLDCLEEERKERYERLKSCAPPGFHAVLEKIIRNVALARPIHICLFIADLLDAEIARSTFDDMVYGCHLKKSQQRKPYPTESCMLLKTWLMSQGKKDVDDKQFLRGPIPQYELAEPALDRYRDYAGIGDFEMSIEPEEKAEEKAEAEAEVEPEDDTVAFPPVTCIPERDLTVPALDRYRDYAGIGPFDPEDVDDECFYYKNVHVPNCTCTFCTLKAEKSRPASKAEKKDPCARPPVVEILYIEQPVYREPAYEKEKLFKEKDIKGYEPFGAIFQQDENYEDDGLQPPDPFQEHPVDRDILADSPQQSDPDDPREAPVQPASPEYCDEETPELDLDEQGRKSAETAVQRVSGVEATEAASEQRVSEVQAETAEHRASEVQAEEAETHETTEESGGAQAEEATQEATEEQAPEAAEQENVEEVQAVAEEEPPAAEPEVEAEPEAAEEAKEEENPEGAPAEEQAQDEAETAEA